MRGFSIARNGSESDHEKMDQIIAVVKIKKLKMKGN